MQTVNFINDNELDKVEMHNLGELQVTYGI